MTQPNWREKERESVCVMLPHTHTLPPPVAVVRHTPTLPPPVAVVRHEVTSDHCWDNRKDGGNTSTSALQTRLSKDKHNSNRMALETTCNQRRLPWIPYTNPRLNARMSSPVPCVGEHAQSANAAPSGAGIDGFLSSSFSFAVNTYHHQ